jgi:hypothetical protein
MIEEIIKKLDKISANKDNEPFHVLGGYIVGATIVRDDIEELDEQYPGLEQIADIGSELELSEHDDSYAALLFKQFQNVLANLKNTLNK